MREKISPPQVVSLSVLLHLGRGHHSGWACRCHPCCIFRSADKVKILFPASNKIFPRLSPWRLVLWIEKTDPRVLRSRDPGLSGTRWPGPGQSYCTARPCRAQPRQDTWGLRGLVRPLSVFPPFLCGKDDTRRIHTVAQCSEESEPWRMSRKSQLDSILQFPST